MGAAVIQALEFGIVVDDDPGVWRGGPPPGTEAPLLGRWVSACLEACATDFDAAAGTPVHVFLEQTLTAFAEAEVSGDVRLLRMRGPESAPLVALVMVLRGQPDVTITQLDPTLSWYAEPTLSVLEPDVGWRRSLAYQVNSDGQLRSVVRYYRHIDSLDADLVLSWAGADPAATAEGLPDLDDLARATWLVTRDGLRR